ncbi:MAG: hypothetical protein LBJ64_06145 [Deltaproteobacteria bacterium]|nr:hypothetical protein [Deltaproteobacteria bacterium]
MEKIEKGVETDSTRQGFLRLQPVRRRFSKELGAFLNLKKKRAAGAEEQRRKGKASILARVFALFSRVKVGYTRRRETSEFVLTADRIGLDFGLVV